MYYTYILDSLKIRRHYIGSCEDTDVRLKKHNTGQVNATRSGIPWRIIHKEEFQTRSEAVRRERQIKSYKSGNAFKKLLNRGRVA